MKKKILIVDDHEDIVLMLTDRLEATGYEIHSASDGKQALELIEQESPHLVFLDLEMPRMSGMEVLHHLAKQKAAGIGKRPSTWPGGDGGNRYSSGGHDGTWHHCECG